MYSHLSKKAVNRHTTETIQQKKAPAEGSFADNRPVPERQQVLNGLQAPIQRTVRFNGTDHDATKWRQLWRTLDWDGSEALRTWLDVKEISSEQVLEMIKEACGNKAINDLGTTNNHAYTWITNVFKGTQGMYGDVPQDLDTLTTLKYESLHVKANVSTGQEFQSMKVGGKIFTTGNKNQFGNITDSTGRSEIGYNQSEDQCTGQNIIDPTAFAEDTHAEIILLTRFVRQVFDNGFTSKNLSIAGRRVPCSHCQQVINQFLIANKGVVTLDYLSGDQAGTMGTARQKVNPGGYTNALSKLYGIVTDDAVDRAEERTQEEKDWLKRMIPVISFVPHDV